MDRHPLITAPELAERLHGGPGDVPHLLDVRWQLGAGDGYDAYLLGHIPGAVFVDLERDLSGTPAEDGTGGRHPMPRVDDFEFAMASCGVDDERLIVVYDDWNSIAAARCWWLLRHFGKFDVRVLDGGLSAWRAQGRRLASGVSLVEEGDFLVRRSGLIALDADQARLYAREGILLDGRPPERFAGQDDSVDPVAGHIPGARNVPARSLIGAGGLFLPPGELRAKFAAVGVDGEVPVATYCGSGVQASHLALAVSAAGLGGRTPVYVGSWSDWISDSDSSTTRTE